MHCIKLTRLDEMLTGEDTNSDTEKMQSKGNGNSYDGLKRGMMDSASEDEDPSLRAIKARIEAARNARRDLEIKKLEETNRTPRTGFEVRPLPTGLSTPSGTSTARLQQDFQMAYAQLNTPLQEMRRRPPAASALSAAPTHSEGSETEDQLDDEFKELDEKYKHLVSNTQRSTETISDLKAKLDAQRAAYKRAVDVEREAGLYGSNGMSTSNSNSAETVSTSTFSTTSSGGSVPDPKALAERIDRLGKTIQKVRSDIEDEDASLVNLKETSELIDESQHLSQRLESIVQTIQASDIPQRVRANIWHDRLNRIINAVIVVLIILVLHSILTVPSIQRQISGVVDDAYAYLRQRHPRIVILGQYAEHAERALQWLTGQWNERRPF